MFNVGDEVVICDTGGKQSYRKVLLRHGKIEHKRIYYIDADIKDVDYYIRIDGFWNDHQEKGYWVCDEKMLQRFVRVSEPQNTMKAKVLCCDDIIKKENKMDILEVYQRKQQIKLEKQEEEAIENIKKLDVDFVKLCKFANDPKSQHCIDIDAYQFTENILYEMGRVHTQFVEKCTELKEFLYEVKAQLDMCETYDQKQAVLTQYKYLKTEKSTLKGV